MQPLTLGWSRKMTAKLQNKRVSGQRRPAESPYDSAAAPLRRLVLDSKHFGKPVEQNGAKR